MSTSNAPPETLTIDRLSTPLGTALLVTEESGILRAFNWTDYEPAMVAWIGKHYPRAQIVEGRAPPSVRGPFEAYFAGAPRALESVLWQASGTAFQLQVWTTLCGIPSGETISYGELARRIGRPTAVRAVGLANGANPVAVVVPCHRVIGANGALTGYGGGLDRKAWLLKQESVRGMASAY